MTWRNSDDWDRQRREAGNERNRIVMVKALVILHTTDKALLVIEKETLEALKTAGGNVGTRGLKHWIPISQVRSISGASSVKSLDKDDEVDLGLPLWLAQEKGFLYEEHK